MRATTGTATMVSSATTNLAEPSQVLLAPSSFPSPSPSSPSLKSSNSNSNSNSQSTFTMGHPFLLFGLLLVVGVGCCASKQVVGQVKTSTGADLPNGVTSLPAELVAAGGGSHSIPRANSGGGGRKNSGKQAASSSGDTNTRCTGQEDTDSDGCYTRLDEIVVTKPTPPPKRVQGGNSLADEINAVVNGDDLQLHHARINVNLLLPRSPPKQPPPQRSTLGDLVDASAASAAATPPGPTATAAAGGEARVRVQAPGIGAGAGVGAPAPRAPANAAGGHTPVMLPRGFRSSKKKRVVTPEIIAAANAARSQCIESFQQDDTLNATRIAYSSLFFTRVISTGAFGEVWLAQLENRQVAVKRILQEKKHEEKEIRAFASEIQLMACFQHPRIVKFVGVAWNNSTRDFCAVTEYMARGDLHGFLKRKVGLLQWHHQKLQLAIDVVQALGYLHSLTPKVIHRDLKSNNILLDQAFSAKLSDFGISRKRSLEETMTAGVGTIFWTAPEVLLGKKYTEKADIYSFGVVLSELDLHEMPYFDVRDDTGKRLQGMKVIQMVLQQGLRPTFSSKCPSPIQQLATRCLDADADTRPDAIELLRILQDEVLPSL